MNSAGRAAAARITTKAAPEGLPAGSEITCELRAVSRLLIVCGRIKDVEPIRVRLAMLLDALHAQKEAINAACRQFGARRIRVFGSVARGEDLPDSDIDFLVDFPQGYDLFAQRLPLTERLAEITGRRLDVIPEHELNRHIRAKVLREAVDL